MKLHKVIYLWGNIQRFFLGIFCRI